MSKIYSYVREATSRIAKLRKGTSLLQKIKLVKQAELKFCMIRHDRQVFESGSKIYVDKKIDFRSISAVYGQLNAV